MVVSKCCLVVLPRTIVFVLIVITHRTGQRQLDSLRTAVTVIRRGREVQAEISDRLIGQSRE